MREMIPDLPKASPEYKAHAHAIAVLFGEARQHQALIRKALEAGQRRAMQERREIPKLPSLHALDRPEHLNCHGIQILFHHVGMEAFNREYGDNDDVAELWPLLHRIAATRLSVMQFAQAQKPLELVSKVRELDEKVLERAGDDVQVPSITPHLFKPQTAMSQLRKMLGKERFKDLDITLNMTELFPNDDHVLHSACMGLIADGSYDVVIDVLKTTAEQRNPEFKQHALLPFFIKAPDLFSAFIIAQVDSGKTAEAVSWCKRQNFREMVRKHEKLAEKFAAALRNQGKFEEAMLFLQEVRDAGLDSRALATQHVMAQRRDTSILPRKLGE